MKWIAVAELVGQLNGEALAGPLYHGRVDGRWCARPLPASHESCHDYTVPDGTLAVHFKAGRARAK